MAGASKQRLAADPAAAARIDLAAAFRLAARMGFNEGICNHFSLALPGTPGRFLLNPYGHHWSEVCASDLLVVDTEGKLVAGHSMPEPTAFFIHSRIHRGNPRAACVMHTHMPYATTLTTLVGGRLEWISQTSARFYANTAYYDDYNGLVLDDAEGNRITAALGDKRVLFLANHGVIVVGETVAQAFDELYYLERACQLQVLAYQTGRPLRRISDTVMRRAARQIETDQQSAPDHFAALKRLLDCDEPEYRD